MSNRTDVIYGSDAYIEASPDEKGVSVSHDYYRHFESNDKAFDDMLSEEGTVTTEKVMVTGNDAKVNQASHGGKGRSEAYRRSGRRN